MVHAHSFQLGCGQFGQVWLGWLSKPRVSDSMAEKVRLQVAVKGIVYLTWLLFSTLPEFILVTGVGKSAV